MLCILKKSYTRYINSTRSTSSKYIHFALHFESSYTRYINSTRSTSSKYIHFALHFESSYARYINSTRSTSSKYIHFALHFESSYTRYINSTRSTSSKYILFALHFESSYTRYINSTRSTSSKYIHFALHFESSYTRYINSTRSTSSKMYIQRRISWSWCTLYLHACQVRVTVGDSGLCCCTRVTYSSANLLPCVLFLPLYFVWWKRGPQFAPLWLSNKCEELHLWSIVVLAGNWLELEFNATFRAIRPSY